MSEWNRIEWLQIQLRHLQYKLEIQKKQNNKAQQMLETSTKCTNIIVSSIESRQPWKAFDLLVDMNEVINTESQNMENCEALSEKYYETMYETVNQLTSKDKQVGVARTPEMHNFQSLMNSHCQMYTKQNWKRYNEYSQNKTKNKPTINN